MSEPRRPAPPPSAPRRPASPPTARRPRTDAARPASAASTPAAAPSDGSWAPVVWPGAAEPEAPIAETRTEAVPRAVATRPTTQPDRARSSVAVATKPALETALARARERVESTRAAVLDRAGERKRATRRLRVTVWARRAAYVTGVLVVAWIVLLSPVFALDPVKVDVSGYGTVVDPTAVRAAVATFEGTSLAMLNTGRVASDIKDIPGVRAAHIERSWPAGLVITIESREPVAAVPDPAGGYVFVDDQAVQVGRSETKPTDLPTISVPVGEDHARVLQAVLGVVNAMPVDLRNRVDAMSASTEDSVTFTLRKGPRVEWGNAENSELKAQVLAVLLGSKQASKAAVIDVSAPTLPITKDK